MKQKGWGWMKFWKRLGAVVLLFAIFAACYAANSVVWPSQTKQVRSSDSLRVDVGNASQGYVLIAGEKTKKKLKLRIKKGEVTLTYDLNKDGEFEVFPLQLGSGNYSITLYKQTSGNKYAKEGSVNLEVALEREDAAYLVPNQYVSYTEDTAAVKKSFEICEGLTAEKDIYDTVCNWVTHNLTYDFIKAVTVETGSLPDIDACFEKSMGICQDLSALTVCMLRVQGIAARLVIGYVDQDAYHAWVEATVDGEKCFFDPTVSCGGLSKQSVYAEERSY